MDKVSDVMLFLAVFGLTLALQLFYGNMGSKTVNNGNEMGNDRWPTLK
jgi:hypothetical protein